MAQVENGYLKVHIRDLYDSLPEEERKEFLRTLSWSDDVLEDLEYELINGLATNSYNSHIFNLRKKLLEQQGDLKERYIQAILNELDTAKNYEEYYQNRSIALEKIIWELNNYVTEPCRRYPTQDKYPNTLSVWSLKDYIKELIETCK